MQNSLEHLNVVVECSLSQVINLHVPLRYFLITSELQSLLQRAKARNKPLATDLENLIQKQLSILSRMPQLEEYILLARRGKDTEAMEKLGHLTQGEEAMLFVRHLAPSEYEKLQMFPQDWTNVGTEV